MAKSKRNPKSLQLSELKEVLQLAGSHEATDQTIENIIVQGGAITNEDGTYNFFHVVAWLVSGVK